MRKTWIRLFAATFALSLVLAACTGDGGGEGETGSETGGGQGTAGSYSIPESTVRFAYYPCCADQSLWAVTQEKGFWSDVGITIEPEGGFLYPVFDQITPSMQRGDYDAAATFIQGYLQTLPTFGMDIPPILFHDIYVGYAILVAPDSSARTTEEFMADGMSFPEAAAAAVSQLEGAEVYTPPHGQVQPPYPQVFLNYADLTYPDDLNLQFLEDNRIVQLSAQPGRVEFAIPYAAPVLVQMLRNGYEPLINTQQVLENDVDSENGQLMTTLVGSSGIMAQRSWVEADHDTVLRFASAAFRTLDYCLDPATQMDCWTIEANQINATQGLDLIPEDIGVIFESIDPLFPWEEQGPQLWENPDAQFYVRDSLDVQIASLIENGTLPDQEYDIDQFLVAEDIYFELRDLQEEADALFAEADGLTGEAGELVAQAQTQYDNYNFLDAVGFLNAALGQ
jgi:ABC-type nitrate/sulfonate/bicarbonate transport system substrate-binding protein